MKRKLVPYIVSFVVIFGHAIIWERKNPMLLAIVVSAGYFCAHAFFRSSLWKAIAKEGVLNSIPTYFVILPAIVFIAIPMTACSLLVLLCDDSFAYAIAPGFFRTFLYLLGGNLVFTNAKPERGDSEVPLITVLNHVSFIDALIIPCCAHGESWSIIAAKKMFWIPPFSIFLGQGRGISVERDRTRKVLRSSGMKAFRRAKSLLERGVHLFMFPEGTRIRDARLLGGFELGTFFMACSTLADIEPVIHIGTRQFAPARGRLWLCPGNISLRYGSIIPAVGETPESLKEKTHTAMETLLTQYI